MLSKRESQELKQGINPICRENGGEPDMMMDIDILTLSSGTSYTIDDLEKECAVLLLEGEVKIKYEDSEVIAKRSTVFDEKPYCLHVCKGVKITIEALEYSELVLQKAFNERSFPSKLYTPEIIVEDVLGDGAMQGMARRKLRNIFDYSNAPYSNMVMGELINAPGKWSSYPPHGHPQPEVYIYRFTETQGFGTGYIGDNAYKVIHNSALLIPGGPTHPQNAAPGYGMYYCWMIRHLPNDPWQSRIDDPAHTWLHDPDAKIWDGLST